MPGQIYLIPCLQHFDHFENWRWPIRQNADRFLAPYLPNNDIVVLASLRQVQNTIKLEPSVDRLLVQFIMLIRFHLKFMEKSCLMEWVENLFVLHSNQLPTRASKTFWSTYLFRIRSLLMNTFKSVRQYRVDNRLILWLDSFLQWLRNDLYLIN